MKTHPIVWAGIGVLAVALIVLLPVTLSLRRETGAMRVELTGMRDSLMLLHRVADSLKQQQPGLGEYMSTMQLHAAKLWCAARESNWKLAGYELDELDETMGAAEGLHARKDNVDVSSVLESVRRTQLPVIGASLKMRNARAFDDAYRQTLAACNGCHRPAGYGFIRIIIPTGAPVTNQQWRE